MLQLGANLSGATGTTNELLELQAESLEMATMLNGQKYEDWLKSKGQEDVEGREGVFGRTSPRVSTRSTLSPAEVRGGVLILRGNPPPR